MSELIDKDAFLKQERKWYFEDCDRRKGVKNGRKCFVYEIGEVPCRACDVDDVLDDLECFETIAASPWHRVEEELPKSGEFGEIVLACNDVGTVNAAFLSSSGKWYAANNTMYDAWTWMPNVTHWMPLPKPPKEDE